eukprot:scaffold6500_cov109-Isochrysis_galbana.AAC.3
MCAAPRSSPLSRWSAQNPPGQPPIHLATWMASSQHLQPDAGQSRNDRTCVICEFIREIAPCNAHLGHDKSP